VQSLRMIATFTGVECGHGAAAFGSGAGVGAAKPPAIGEPTTNMQAPGARQPVARPRFGATPSSTPPRDRHPSIF
jgi:hypothetical protein